MERAEPTITELMERTHAINVANGWWPPEHLERVKKDDVGLWIIRLALVGTEVAEAIEDVRDGAFRELAANRGPGVPEKPVGLPSELADIVIRVMDAAHGAGIDLAGAIERKLAYNATRGYKHGGKAR